MRSYGKNWKWKKTATYKQRQTRLATEWDVRLDVNEYLTIEDIIANVQREIDGFLYVLVSGVEHPDIVPTQGCNTEKQIGPWNTGKNQYGSTGNHTHLCVVLNEPKQRNDVLELLRGRRKVTDEYCAPRNQKFSYAGWVIHHAKLDSKVTGEPGIRYEHGTLPMDPITIEWALSIVRMVEKYKPSDGVKNRFKHYLDLVDKTKIKEKIEKLQMQLEDNDVQ